MDKKELAQHKNISFTAHYTGYRWYQLGLSHPAFATQKGKLFTALLAPLETWTERKVGNSIGRTLEHRHLKINALLTTLLVKHPDLQVVELACGLSPRGWYFRQHYPHLHYIEVDLPDMAAIKRTALAQAGQADATVLGIDVFSGEIEQIYQQLDQNKPLIMISEGLINYFSLEVLKQLWITFVQHGQEFPQFYYLTDLYPELKQGQSFAGLVKLGRGVLRFLSRSVFNYYFATPQAAQHVLLDCGFRHVDIWQPSQPDLAESHVILNSHYGDFVWVVLASLQQAHYLA